MSSPVVHLYASCWNEARLLPLVLDHYDRFVDEYTIFDNGSDDGSAEILDAHPRVQRVPFEVPGDSLVAHLTELYNSCWKSSRGRADWVMVTNLDELMWHPDTPALLQWAEQSGHTLLSAQGYEMVSLRFPRPHHPLVEQVRWGMAWDRLSKPQVFRPDAIDEINFAAGRHTARPTGDVSVPDRPVWQLRHHKYLGYRYTVGRWRELGGRLREGDLRTGAGHHWLFSDTAMARRYLGRLRRARRVPEVPPVPMLDGVAHVG